ncbi:SEC-C metal-binding domain-containing protein [Acidovorax sp. 69]|uniref:SEC-C metal-binding domain-containing protein n=1 Tax=Acidovorax sp. 69 TaxID=2035202 RepID=UPI000C24F6B7
MSRRNDPCHCGSGKKYKRATGLRWKTTDLIAASAYGISARGQFCLFFHCCPVRCEGEVQGEWPPAADRGQ